MKLRVVLVLLSLGFSLITGADRLPDSCREAWTPALNVSTFPQGIGVNVHFIDPRPGEIKMIADAGFRWIRTDFQWGLTEPERGRYDFSPYERLLASLDQHGMRALFILDYGNPLYTDDKAVRGEAARQAFARWAVAAAKHFAGRGIVWECFNEPNIPMFWPPKPNVEEYIALALTVGRAFRAASDDSEAAQLMGVNNRHVYALATASAMVGSTRWCSWSGIFPGSPAPSTGNQPRRTEKK